MQIRFNWTNSAEGTKDRNVTYIKKQEEKEKIKANLV